MNIYIYIALEHCALEDLSSDIKMFVLVKLVIFGIGHYRTHLCFTNKFLFKMNLSVIYWPSQHGRDYCVFNTIWI